MAHEPHRYAQASVIDELRGRKLLLAASTGGHLAQLDLLSRMIEPRDDSLWVTFDSPQSRSLEDGRRLVFLDYISPRDWRRALSGARALDRILRDESFDAVVSTGAAIAVSALSAASRRRVKRVYVESVSRYDGPSLSGRIVSKLPGTVLRTQHPEWASPRWPFEFSVMDAWERDDRPEPLRPADSFFVTLGTIRPYRFDSLVDRLLEILPADAQVVWQLGSTTRDDLPGRVHAQMSHDTFCQEADRADVVITHAGVGSIMELLARRRPIVAVPRRASRNEHVDDHQLQVTADLQVRGLAAVAEADELTLNDLESCRLITVRDR